MENKLLIDVARLDPEGESFSGEVDVVDLEEDLVHPFGGVRYELTAQLFGTELLVRGHLEQDFTLVCSRCGKDFDDTVKVDDFIVSLEVSPKDEYADLTNDVRECIILALPTYPLCEESCPGIVQTAEKPSADCWGALDAIRVKPSAE